MMQPEQLRESAAEALRSAAADVLETMFFAPADPIAPPDRPGPLLTAGLNFQGQWRGSFQLRVPEAGLPAMMESFSGQAGDGLDCFSQMLCELANMVCGAALGKMKPDGRFDLGSPGLLEAGAAAPEPEEGIGVQQWIDVGNGPMQLRMHFMEASL